MGQSQNKRLTYIDALRGLAMFSVVVGHVWLHTESEYNPFFQVFNVALQLPLFFFISGFLYHYRAGWWKWIKSKFYYLVIPAIIFLALFCLSEDRNFIGGIKHDFKYGYWFTLSLFEFFVIYSLLDILLKKWKINIQARQIIHIVTSLVIYYLSFRADVIGVSLANLFSLGLTKYYVFFVLGITIREVSQKYKAINYGFLLNFIGGGYLIILTLFLYGQNAGYFYVYGPTPILLFSMFSVAFFVIFFKNSHYIEHNSMISRCLVYMGRHSLDIYFIHYFLLPVNITFINEFFDFYPSAVFEYLSCALIAIAITVVSLAIGNMIRFVPLLSKWMLGVKTDDKPLKVKIRI